MSAEATAKLTRKDFVSDQDVRWCPGCGDYSILAQVQKIFPDLGIPKEKTVFISGIGCSSRFPYYMNTYGFHTIHGRAPAIATGLKISRPDLNVWLVTGDGDGLSIGGNHLIHALRRNVELKIMLFNNRIYGLTKGQYSPTSEIGKVAKSTPMGSTDYPINPLSLVLGAEATFVARSIDVEAKHQQTILTRAAEHKGGAFIEILQNCNVYNDGAWESLTDKGTKADTQLLIEHGKPMIFGKEKNRGIRLNGLAPEVVQIGNGVTADDLLVHDEHDRTLAFILSRMIPPNFPTPIGIVYSTERPTIESLMAKQLEAAVANQGKGDIDALLNRGDVWTVK
jgi:2-oxoglutarate ferredoxin oxidoreductase subunit beta